MSLRKLSETLNTLERKVLPVLKQADELNEIVLRTGLKQIEVMRALQWLENKKLVELSTESHPIIELDENGRRYLNMGLPEKRFLEALRHERMGLDQIASKARLERPEINVCIGLLKKKAAIDIAEGMQISITPEGKKLLDKEMLEEKLLKKISENKMGPDELAPEERFAFDQLKKRKQMIKVEEKKTRTARLLEDGKKVIRMRPDEDSIDALTPKLLKTGEWKDKRFRRYDVSINVPAIQAGKRHFINQALDYVKTIWLELGFKEMQGSMVQTSFWNFDALFTAQDHPVRDMHDTFFIGKPKTGKLPSQKIVQNVKKAHEKGTAGSKGWNYSWDPKEAMKNVLRTHTTCLSAKTISELKKDDLPAKFFSVGKCFRNETLDHSHLFEFDQVEGIVVDENANFRNLIGYLKDFFRKMGFPDARVRPAYFPYTEPSAEIDVYDPERKEWIELGGCGIFRPEVVEPLLGKDVPVLAWGMGFARLVLRYYKIKDIRDLNRNDISQLREMKVWLR